jgi:hypothetical protein
VDQVVEQVVGQVVDQKIEWNDFSGLGLGGWNIGWTAFLDYFARIGIDFREHSEIWQKWISFLDLGVWDCILLQGVAILCRAPLEVKRDERNELHNTSGPAVRWADGYGSFFVHGVRFNDPAPILDHASITAERVFSETNVEVRRTLIDLMGRDRFVAEAEFKIRHHDHETPLTTCQLCFGLDPVRLSCAACGTLGLARKKLPRRLLSRKLEGDEPMVLLEVTCPSTGKQTLLRVPPDTRTCHAAAAWVAGFDDPAQYRPLVEA